MSVRKLNWYESKDDAINIKKNKWNLQVTKAVASGSAAPTYNLIWKSRALAPKTYISWNVQYALGWTAQVPNDGVAISIEGDWQPCDKGESFDIDDLGYWKPSPSSVPRKADWLQVGNIDYNYPGVLGIHIVIGLRSADSGLFEPIFVDQTTMQSGSSGVYQPQETVSWWLVGGDRTGEVFSGTKSQSTSQDYTKPSDPLTNSYEWSTSYLFVPPTPENPKHWVVTPGAPPQSRSAPPPSAPLKPLTLGGEEPMVLQLDLARWIVTFARPLAALALSAAAASLYKKLKPKLKKLEVSIEGTGGAKLRVVYEPGSGSDPGTVAFPGTPLGDAGGPVGTIDGALREMLASGDIPAGETWDISQDTRADVLASPTPPSNSSTFRTAAVRRAPQTAEPNIPNNASDGSQQHQQQHPQQQQQQPNGATQQQQLNGGTQQQQPNGSTTVPSKVSLSKPLSSSPAVGGQLAGYTSQNAESNASDIASSALQHQPNGGITMPGKASLSKALTRRPAPAEQPVEYTSQNSKPNNTTGNAASSAFQHQSNGRTIVPTHFNEANPNGVQLITI